MATAIVLVGATVKAGQETGYTWVVTRVETYVVIMAVGLLGPRSMAQPKVISTLLDLS
jgi:hypothetical protein